MDALETDDALAFLSQYWWLMAFRGLIIFTYGVLVFTWPEMTTFAFLILFELYVLVGGIYSVVLALRAQKTKIKIGTWIVTALVIIVLGAVTFALPGLSALALVGIVGVWSLVLGLLELLLAVQLLKVAKKWPLLFAGALTCGTGVIILTLPLQLFFFDVAWLGGPAIFIGALLLLLAFRMRRIAEGATS